MKTKQNLYRSFLIDSWWVFLFLFIVAIAYENQIQKTLILRRELKTHLNQLKAEKREMLKEQQKLQLQIQSQSDRKWIELILMKKLGLVPKGERKIVLYRKNNPITSENH